MGSRERVIYILKILVLISIVIWLLYNNKEDYVDDYNNKIKALEAKVDSLHSINDNLTYKIDTLNVQINSLDKEIVNQDNLIKNLRIKTNEKVKAVDNFNDDELYQFFTERYRQYLDSIRKTDSKTSN
jgi:predicted  nucleic acid-binding Zn-ribbon protein|tara:strand:+ start:244 stop:627 length:384 start_codon:yes stop_codon:yes gene_type:complete